MGIANRKRSCAMGKTVLMLLVVAALAGTAVSAGELAGRRMAWAHYVPWFKPENASLEARRFYNFPLTGVDEAESRRVSTRREIDLAMASGIDGWFIDLGTNAKQGPLNSSGDFPGYLEAAEGTDFQIGICLDGRGTPEYLTREIVRLLKAYGNHPNYPKENGRHVVCAYSFLHHTAEEWNETIRRVRENGFDIYLMANVNPLPWKPIEFEKFEACKDVMDAAFMFSAPGHAKNPPETTNRELREWCAANGKRAIPSLHPGYWGAWLKGDNDFYHPFRCMDMLYRIYEAGKAAGPGDWIHVTTWNDLAETVLMPCVFTPGITRLMHAYCDGLKGQDIASPETRVNFAYHREELAGAMWRIEAMAMPRRGGSDVRIEGALLAPDGSKAFKLEPRRLAGDGFLRCEWLVPTVPLSELASFTPCFHVRDAKAGMEAEAVLPSVMLVTGWLRNAVTVNVALEDMLSGIQPELRVSQTGEVLEATLAVRSPEKIRRAILFRNDRAWGVLEPDGGVHTGEWQRMISLDGINGDLTLSVTNGRIVRAAKNFERNGQGCWKWDAQGLVTRKNPPSSAHGIVVSGGADLEIHWHAEKGEARFDDCGPDLTTLNAALLDVAEGILHLRRKSPAPCPNDSFWTLVETESGKLHYSPVIWPFDAGHRLVERSILETATTLETPCGCAGYALRDDPEFLTPADEVPVRSNRVVKCQVPIAGSRHAEWNLLDRKGVFELPKRTWPQGTMRIAMRVWPNAHRKRQTLVYQKGWSDGVTMDMTVDGRIELIRGFEVGTKGSFDRMTGQTTLEPERWHDIVVEGDMAEIRLWVDGVLDAQLKPTRVRSHDDCRIFIGGGPGCEPFMGKIETLTIDGL